MSQPQQWNSSLSTHGLVPGFMLSMGAIAVPTMLDTNQSATQLLNQFKCFFGHGHRYAAPTVLVAALLHAFTSWKKRVSGKAWKLSAIAAVITALPWPYTGLFLAPINQTMFRWRAGTTTVPLSSVQEKFRQWNRLHVLRSMFPLAGALVGLAALDR